MENIQETYYQVVTALSRLEWADIEYEMGPLNGYFWYVLCGSVILTLGVSAAYYYETHYAEDSTPV